MKRDSEQEIRWVGFPEPTDEDIEKEAVSLIRAVIEFKRRNDRPGGKWKVGTKKNTHQFEDLSENETLNYWCILHGISPQKAALELAEYHGMEIDGKTSQPDTCIYTYTDRLPTIKERRQLEKEPLSVKQKRVFRAIKEHVDRNGQGPTERGLMRALGYRSPTTIRDFLRILENKNWILLRPGQERIELI